MIQQGFLNKYKMYKREGKLDCLEYENGLILPRVFDGNTPIWGKGGVCDSENKFVPLSEYHGGWAEHGGYYNWTDEQYLDDTVVYFGVFFNHWGHFLVDLIGRMWYCTQNQSSEIKVAYLGEEDPKGNFLEFFELMGIKKEQLIRITKPTRCRKVIVPEFSCRPCIWYSDEYQSIFDAVISRVLNSEKGIPNVKQYKKIYFTRLKLPKARSSEFGEKLIVEWMEKNGYEILSPERLSLRQQIFLWNTAEEIACINGSIPINCIFSQNPNLKLIVLNKTKLVHKNLDLFLLIRQQNVTFLDVYYEPFKNYPKSIGAGPFMLYISEDIYKYSTDNDLDVPFSKIKVRKDFLCNYIRLILKVGEIKIELGKKLYKVYLLIKKIPFVEKIILNHRVRNDG